VGQQWDVVARAADVVERRLGRAPVGVVLGTGLSECLDNLEHPQYVEYAEIPGLPVPTIFGHRGALVRGLHAGVPVLALCGRIHMYEGRPGHEVALGVRMLSLLGVHTLLVTSAVSSLGPELRLGQIMLVEDHLNLSGTNVVAGAHDERFGPHFPDLSDAYDAHLLEVLQEVGQLAGLTLGRGILAHWLGPSYETAAEARLARTAGARVTSMSMVPEVIAARQRGMRVAGLACITNANAILARTGRVRDEILASSAEVAASMQTLLSGAIPRLGNLSPERPRTAFR